MAEPFKNLIDAPLIEALATHLHRIAADFSRAAFARRARRGLDGLELKARVRHVAQALEEFLPGDFPTAARYLVAALAPARTDTDLSALRTTDEGLAGWVVWPMTEYVARRGLGEPEPALAALHAMTQRFSAEFAIRPFLREHPGVAFAALRRWLHDPSAHVRRLVSEGSRPRLPWGEVLRSLVADPSPTLPLLRALQDDPSDYVRRSVANHLNDIAKDHPDLVAEWIERHLPDALPQRRMLLRRAGRTLVKRGHRRALLAFGIGAPFVGTARLRVRPARVQDGGSVSLEVELRSRSTAPQRLAIDYVVHRVCKNGSTSPKVWKGWVTELPGGRGVTRLVREHSLRPVTTRRNYPGWHAIELVVNGVVAAAAGFLLEG